MQEIHKSEVSVRDPTVDLEVYTINSTTLLDYKYNELSDFLSILI